MMIMLETIFAIIGFTASSEFCQPLLLSRGDFDEIRAEQLVKQVGYDIIMRTVAIIAYYINR